MAQNRTGTDICRKVRAYIEEYGMICAGDVVLAGVSGGPDSVAMLSMLAEYRRQLDFELLALHVNHGIRGGEADRDQQFVESLCGKWEIPCRAIHIDVPGIAAKYGIGLEEAGRMARRETFAAEAEKWTAKGSRVRIAVAHNQNDQAETMLHHMARGSGLRGMGSLSPAAGNYIRPVLCLERREIDDYLRERAIPAVEDSSNREDAYTRNRIRHHVLPVLEREVNGRAVSHMAEMSRILREADDCLSEQGRHLSLQCRKTEKSFFFGENFRSAHQILQEYALLESMEILAGRRKDLASVHVADILALFQGKMGGQVSLPYGMRAQREYEGVRLWVQTEEEQDLSDKEWKIPLPGRLTCPLGVICAEIFLYAGQEISEKKYTKWLDYDKIRDGLVIRTRRTGDYLEISQDNKRKKVSRILIDDKIPREERNRLPLVACGGEVLWMVGGRISGRYKITLQTKRVLQLKYQGGNQNERENQSVDQ